MPSPPPDAAGYRFDDVEIDLRRRELRVAGALEPVEPRVYELIVALIEGRERAFGKDELVELLWGRPVSDASLSQLVYKARRALREDDARCFIETVRGHGFRWGVEVDTRAASADAAPETGASGTVSGPARAIGAKAVSGVRRTGLSIAAAVLALVVASVAIHRWLREAHAVGAIREVLVLPLENRTGEDGLAWTQDGLPGLLVSVLNRMPELHGVVGRPTAQSIGIEDADRRRAARIAAGADQVVFLSLSRAGPLLRLDLVSESESGRNSAALFGAEPAPLALDAVNRIGEWHGGDAARPPSGGRPMDDFLTETYARGMDAFLNGRMETARNHFAICAERRPDMVWPRLQLATTEMRLGHSAVALRLLADIERGADALTPEQARYLRLRIADSRLDAGDATAAKRNYEAVAAEAETAGDRMLLRVAWSGLGHVEALAGNGEAAARWLQQVIDIDRRNGDRRREAIASTDLAELAFQRGDFAMAERLFVQVGDMARQQDLPFLQQKNLASLAGTNLAQGRAVAAAGLYRQALAFARESGDADAEVDTRAGLAIGYAMLGRKAQAALQARRALELARRNGQFGNEAIALVANARATGDGREAAGFYAEAAERFERSYNWPLAAALRWLLVRELRLLGDATALDAQVERLATLAREHAEVHDVVVLARAARAEQQAMRGDSGALAKLEEARSAAVLPAGARWRRLLTIESARLALDAGDLKRAGSVIEELAPARGEDPEALQLQRRWLLASGREDAAARVAERLEQLASALADPREDAEERAQETELEGIKKT